MSSVRIPVACLDFDGTLCPGDSIVPFLLFSIRSGLAPGRQLFSAAAGFLLQKLHVISPGRATAMTLSFLKGKDEEEIRALGRRFAEEKLLPRCFPGALAFLDKLHAEGYHTVIVSASTDVYMFAMQDLLRADAVLSTVVETDARGKYTGRILSNCRGEEKVRRIRAYLAGHPELDGRVSLAVGDSLHDLPMLGMAQTRLIVGSSRKLKNACPQAESAGW